jgi:four helix bundle protein
LKTKVGQFYALRVGQFYAPISTRGSVQECVPLLELARRRRLITDDNHSILKERLEEIARMHSGLINGLDNREV